MNKTYLVDHLGAQGDGVIEDDDGPIYAALTAPGDRVTGKLDDKAKGGRRLVDIELVEAGPARREPACPHYGPCGGCSLQHIVPETYAAWLPERISTALAQQGFESVRVAPSIVSPEHSRRRVLLGAIRTTKNTVLGYRMRKSHQIVDVRDCLVIRPEIMALFNPVRATLHALLRPGDKADVKISWAYNGADMVIEGPRPLDLDDRERLADLADAQDLASLIWVEGGFDDPVAVRRKPVVRFNDITVVLPPGAFLQATEEGQDTLIEHVLAACTGASLVADLFCGIGTFSLPLAKHAKVLGVEGDLSALTALGDAAKKSGLKPLKTLHRDLFRRPMTAEELEAFDAVVFDPPRAGAAAQAKELARSNVARVVAISCNPNSFARDARLLCRGGYQLKSIQPVDQFLYSKHLELLAVFDRD